MGLRPMGQVLNVCSTCFLVSMRGAGWGGQRLQPQGFWQREELTTQKRLAEAGTRSVRAQPGTFWPLSVPPRPHHRPLSSPLYRPCLSFCHANTLSEFLPPGLCTHCPFKCSSVPGSVAPAHMSNVRGALTFLPESTHWYSVSSHDTLLSPGGHGRQTRHHLCPVHRQSVSSVGTTSLSALVPALSPGGEIGPGR